MTAVQPVPLVSRMACTQNHILLRTSFAGKHATHALLPCQTLQHELTTSSFLETQRRSTRGKSKTCALDFGQDIPRQNAAISPSTPWYAQLGMLDRLAWCISADLVIDGFLELLLSDHAD